MDTPSIFDPNGMSVKEKKQQELLIFFQQNGFDKSIDEIAEGLGITKRTIFNRYQTVQNIECEVLEIWKIDLIKTLNDKFELCNHGIEKLLFTIHELKRRHLKEHDFFERIFQKHPRHSLFLEPIIDEIIFSDFKKGYFNEFIDRKSYIPFFIYNVVYYLTENSSIDVVLYTLYPILSERGYELLRDIDLDILL